jgi:3',5'-cyclic AMP phosphodiesterase CpdA
VKIIAHISDLHFGRHIPEVEAGLLDDLNGRTAEKPTLVAISGDLTQRARRDQFKCARAFLDELTVPYVVVPGNHDIPLYDVFHRFFDPIGRYKRYITDDLTPLWADDDLMVAGIDTAHSFTIKDGIVRQRQLEAVCEQFERYPKRWKIVVAHHPFVVPAQVADRYKVDGADEAMRRLEAACVDLVLTGHLHVSYARSVDAAGYRNEARTVLGVNAGTCISNRHRGEPNSYNKLEVEGDVISIVNRQWNGTQFVDGPEKAYRHGRGAERLVKVAEIPVQPQPL